MITNLRLKNWKSHEDSSFEFSEGVNCIIGNMGSGKSSIMQAISFALFGTFPALQNRKIKLDDLIMKKPKRKSNAEISLEFSAAGKNYSIVRKLEEGRGTVHAEIEENGVVLNSNPAAVTSEVQRLLQIDYELFSRAVYSEQNGLDYFLRIPKGSRMQQIDKMLKVDRFESSREGSVKIKNRLLAQNEEKIKLLAEFEKRNLGQKMKELKTEVRRMERDSGVLELDVKRFSESKNKLEEQMSKLENKKQRLMEIDRDMASIEASLDELKNSLDELKKKTKGKNLEDILREKEESEKNIKLTERNVSDNKNFVNSLREKTASLNTTISDAERKRIPELEKDIEELSLQWKRLSKLKEQVREQMPEETKKHLDRKREELSSLRARIEETSKQISELKSATAVCPTCSKELTEEHRQSVLKDKQVLLEKMRAEIEKYNTVINSLKEKSEGFEKMKQDIMLIEERTKELSEMKAEKESLVSEVGESRKSVKENVEKIQSVEAKIKEDEEELVSMRESFVGAKNLVELVERLGEQDNRVKNYNKKSRELAKEKLLLENSLKSVDVDEIKKRYKESLAREAEATAKLSGISDLLKEKKDRLSEIEDECGIMERYSEEISKDRRIANELDTFITVLRATQDQLREEFLKTVNSLMNEIWPGLYPYEDFEEIRLTIESGDYSLQLKSSEGWVSAEGAVSGGERSLACLALRIAFSMAFIPKLRWLILDEPTHNLDQNAIMQFAEILREKIHNFANQVFLITHEDRISEGVTGHFYKLERKKELDEPTKVLRF